MMASPPPQAFLGGAHSMTGATSPRTPIPASLNASTVSEGLENAGRLVDTHLKEDTCFWELSGQLRIATHAQTNWSGNADIDYPSLENSLPPLAMMPLLGPLRHTPLPSELVQEFQNLQCNCQMGIMPEIRRAWLTIDNTIYMWSYVDGKDLAYFDGLNEVVISVGLVQPKLGVFQDHIQFLLCLTTAVEVIILGVSFTTTPHDQFAEMHLQPEPLFNLPTDNVGMMCIEGTPEGRVLLGGKDGGLYEVVYQAREGWFSKKCKLINHSSSFLSYLVPSFLSFSEEDPVMQLVADSSRQILYSRSNGNTISVYDLGVDGRDMAKVTSMSVETIAQRAATILRTHDKNLFKPLVSLSVIPCSESSTLHLLAVSQAGVRFYFTTTPNGVAARPSLLALVHIRLPPGFSPSSSAHRPGNTVHQSFYRRGTLVLSAAQSEEKDMLWIIDPDSFPFQSTLLESHVSLPLNGQTWAIAETIEEGELEAIASPSPLPPAVVTQHAHPSREFIVVSTQGSYIISKQRPVDQLQYLLEMGKGGNSEAVQAFFKLHRETQASAMCLILATGSNQQVSQWATEAFFKFGGEPRMITPVGGGAGGGMQVGGVSPMQTSPGGYYSGHSPQQQQNTALHGSPPLQTDSQRQYGTPPQGVYGTGPQGQYGMQTPNFGMTLGRAVVGPEVQLSGRHNGLCRYLARLLRPLWNEKVIGSQPPTRNQPEEQFYSRYSFDELKVFLEQIYRFKAFFERNSQLLSPPLERSFAADSPLHSQQSVIQQQRPEASIQEYDSTRFLYQLVVCCYECLSLWNLICEYQLHLTVCGLSQEVRERLKSANFRFLILSGKDLTSALISSLLSRHAGDTNLSDILSERLREITPSLFSHDDAITNKANELVTMAAASQAKIDQLNHLRQSLKFYSQVTHQLDLRAVCARYQSLQYLEGVVELCLCVARQKDPQNLALHFYKSGQPTDDIAGQRAFFERQESYLSITTALKDLLAKDQAPIPPFPLPSRPGPPAPQPEDEGDSPRKQFDRMVALALSSEDELLHVNLYSWFLSINLADRLVEMETPYIEDYLKYTIAIQQNNRQLLDLLWRYYEKNNNYGAAARILDQLAQREGTELTLDERIEYISRAVMCAKSCNQQTSASHEGEFLHELEEKMEVARIQLNILDTLKLHPRSMDVDSAIIQLNSELMDITKLYEHFAEKFDLAECKLGIIHCAGHHNPILIESLWRDIIDKVLMSAGTSPNVQFGSVQSKLVSLGAIYSRSERFFPVAYLALMLEQHACNKSWEVTAVHGLLRELGVSMTVLFKIYDKMFKAKHQFWGNPLHVLDVLCSLLMDYVHNPSFVSIYERPSFNACVLDAISHYLIELQTLSPSTQNLSQVISNLRVLQSSIQKVPM